MNTLQCGSGRYTGQRLGIGSDAGAGKGCHCIRSVGAKHRQANRRQASGSRQEETPLGLGTHSVLQINMRTGVAHGILVVRTPQQCAQMLRKVILRERKFTILHQDGNFLLEERETKSVLRVVSDDPFLTHAFLTYFRHHTTEEG